MGSAKGMIALKCKGLHFTKQQIAHAVECFSKIIRTDAIQSSNETDEEINFILNKLNKDAEDDDDDKDDELEDNTSDLELE